jgi:putative addiction module component (TIGR02574 family)
MRVDDIPEIGRLTVPEKILLLEDLWDSIAAEESSVPVPQSHREELDRRLAEYEKDPGRLLTLDDLRGRVEARR